VIINTRIATSYGAEGDSRATAGLKNFKFINNTILIPTPSSLEAGQTIGGICIPYNSGHNTGSYFENNIVMGGSTGSFAMSMGAFDTAVVPADKLFLGLTIDHNLIYTPSNTTPLLWNGGHYGTAYTHSQWLALAGGAGHGTGDVVTNPNFINAATDAARDKKPQAGSPAINAGTAIPAFVTTDFLGVTRPQGSSWDVGAFEVSATNSLKNGAIGSHADFAFVHNYPNPFTLSTVISYYAPSTRKVKLIVCDMLGRPIRVLFDGTVTPGSQSVDWDGKDCNGKRVVSGVYFIQLKTADFTKTQKMTLSAKS
jgi:hypothetical protein